MRLLMGATYTITTKRNIYKQYSRTETSLNDSIHKAVDVFNSLPIKMQNTRKTEII